MAEARRDPHSFRSAVKNFSFTLVLLALLSPTLATAQAAQTAPAPSFNRVLPLKRFADSRFTKTDPQGFYEMPTGIGDDYFDGTDKPERVQHHLRIARQLGVKYLRCAFSWNGIEPQQGKFRWEFWDRLVAEAERNQIQLIPYVAYTPEWAARAGEDFWKQPPRDPALFARFMETIVARYKGRIRSWELWNEPDLREYWQGTPEEFGELIRQGAQAVRRADPDAVIVLGGMSRGPTDFFRTLIQRERVSEYVDVIAQHAYPESWDPERGETIYFDWTNEIGEMIQASNSGVDYWLNEIGYPDYRFTATNASKYAQTDVYYRYEHTRAYQGVYLFKSFVMSLATGTSSIAVWYRIDDFPRSEKRLGDDLIHFHLGVVDERARPKPSFRAFQFFNRIFGIPTRQVEDRNARSRHPQSKSMVNIFERKDGKVIVTGWLRSPERNEVHALTGQLRDTRMEEISVELPCRDVPSIDYYDAFGQSSPKTARLRKSTATASTSLSNIRLRGDSVFVAVAQCVN